MLVRPFFAGGGPAAPEDVSVVDEAPAAAEVAAPPVILDDEDGLSPYCGPAGPVDDGAGARTVWPGCWAGKMGCPDARRLRGFVEVGDVAVRPGGCKDTSRVDEDSPAAPDC